MNIDKDISPEDAEQILTQLVQVGQWKTIYQFVQDCAVDLQSTMDVLYGRDVNGVPYHILERAIADNLDQTYGFNKISAIKQVRTNCRDCGLRQAKDAVEQVYEEKYPRQPVIRSPWSSPRL